MVELAKADLASKDAETADGAAGFLGNGRIAEELFPSAGFLRLLESGRIRRIQAGLAGLAARNRADDAGSWLKERIKGNDPLIKAYYDACLPYRQKEEIQDWERAVLGQLMKVQPLATLRALSGRPVYGRKDKLPEECMDSLRGFLKDQLTAPQQRWWRMAAQRDLKGRLELEREADCQGFGEGIRILDSLDDPADVPLLLGLLEHPAANANFYLDGSGMLFFTARETAANCLKRRKIQIPGPLVTKIALPAPAPPLEPLETNTEILVRHELPIRGASLVALVAASLALWRIRLGRRPA